MSTSVVSTKGQIVIPADVRADMDVNPGTRVVFVKTKDGWLLKPANVSITSLKGLARKPAEPVSIEDMNETVRKRSRRLFMSR